jgi:hypothetical protein
MSSHAAESQSRPRTRPAHRRQTVAKPKYVWCLACRRRTVDASHDQVAITQIAKSEIAKSEIAKSEIAKSEIA